MILRANRCIGSARKKKKETMGVFLVWVCKISVRGIAFLHNADSPFSVSPSLSFQRLWRAKSGCGGMEKGEAGLRAKA